MEKLTKKYGLLTAICMVVGIVIGSGVFFKAGKVLSFTNGNIGKTLAVVAIVGGIMIICSLVFATLAQKHEKVNGIVDYAEATLGKRYAYYVGWFMSTIYYPTLTSVLGWISASYTCSLFNIPSSTGAQLALAGAFLVAGFAVNSLSPKLAGRFQVSATFIKLIPLVLMGVVGLIVGLVNGKTIDAFKANIVTEGLVNDGGFFAGIAAFAFAYEGWIVATSINGELKILGRVKDTIVLSGGENVEPLPIEAKIQESRFISTAVVVGQDQRNLGALILPNQEELELWAAENNIAFKDFNDLVKKEETYKLIESEIRELINAKNGFRMFEKIVKFAFLTKPFEVGRELSAKQEMIRYRIAEKYSAVIENLFIDE